MEINIREMKIKNRPNYLFNYNMIVNIKEFDFDLLEINVFLDLIYTTLNTFLQIVLNVQVLIKLIMMKIFFICFLMMWMGTLKKTMELNI